ncbi:hypothetical protein K504DRAFT_508917 [Pleomassaria siparia CBS 279.74]|uniref:Uncharacterized protein n=1 Tax=Pleomassaria siparia CBS 279.74 TaxID=1314801 RepID=A0A6G1JQI1_9PLEO|nr:hypothetical protein K504DRAFT_508917 [Pleomassaria siparia CBS 279.74]
MAYCLDTTLTTTRYYRAIIQIVVVAYLAATAGIRAVLLNTPSGLNVVAK